MKLSRKFCFTLLVVILISTLLITSCSEKSTAAAPIKRGNGLRNIVTATVVDINYNQDKDQQNNTALGLN